jgi:hypothetical protein
MVAAMAFANSSLRIVQIIFWTSFFFDKVDDSEATPLNDSNKINNHLRRRSSWSKTQPKTQLERLTLVNYQM